LEDFVRYMMLPIIVWLFVSQAFAGEKTVTLVVENMTCPACPYIVEKSLAAVPGVSKVDVSFADKTAIVTFDDSQTNIARLTSATADAGYPSQSAPQP
jgi:periplasmic mercuric ion binding protein